MRTIRLTAVLFTVVFLPGITAAASLPSFSASDYCKQVSEAVGGSYQIEEGCMQNEKESIQALQSMDIPDRVMSYCTEVAKAVGGSYQILHGCVQNELESKGRLNQ